MLKAYSFDIDYNLFITDTTILLEEKIGKNQWKKIEVSQKDYGTYIQDTLRYRHVNNDIEASMINFKTPGNHEKHVFDAISKGKIGPSYPKYLEAKMSASPTQKNTAGGYPIDELKCTERKFIYEVLTHNQREDLVYSMKERLGHYKQDDDSLIEEYLKNNHYAPCSNEQFLTTIGKNISDPISERKNAAFEAFVLHTKNVFKNYYGADFLATRKIRMGFSDDTHANLEGLHKFISAKDTGLMWKYPDVIFSLYDSTDPTLPPSKFSIATQE